MDDPRLEHDPRRAVARLAVAVMAADGRITSPEVEALARLDQLGLGSLTPFVEDEIDRATREAVDVRAACADLAGASREAACTLLAVLADIATSDRVLAGREREVFDAVARLLGVPERDAAHVLTAAAEHAGPAAGVAPDPIATVAAGPAAARAAEPAPRTASAPAPADAERHRLLARARRVLGVDGEVSRDALDAAYLAIVARYDPAGVAAMGPEFVALAVRKLADATAAWELLGARDARA